MRLVNPLLSGAALALFAQSLQSILEAAPTYIKMQPALPVSLVSWNAL